MTNDVDEHLVALSNRFDRYAADWDEYARSGCDTDWGENVEETCLEAVSTALLEAAIAVRHRTKVGRAAKEKMLAHLERWAGSDSVPYSKDSNSRGGRLALSLM